MSLQVKDWKKFQHFKDRRPPWIKLYREILDDIEWHELDPIASKVLVMVWLIASESDGVLPAFKELAFRLRMTERQVETVVSKLGHWLIQDDIGAISEQTLPSNVSDHQETETETYKEEKEKSAGKPAVFPKSRKTSLPNGFGDDWSPSMRAWLAEHCPEGVFVSHLEYFVGYAKANGKQYVDWEQAFQNAIKGNWAKVTPQSSSRLALYS